MVLSTQHEILNYRIPIRYDMRELSEYYLRYTPIIPSYRISESNNLEFHAFNVFYTAQCLQKSCNNIAEHVSLCFYNIIYWSSVHKGWIEKKKNIWFKNWVISTGGTESSIHSMLYSKTPFATMVKAVIVYGLILFQTPKPAFLHFVFFIRTVKLRFSKN